MKLRYLKENQKKVFFFEKKEPKNFCSFAPAPVRYRGVSSKSAGEKGFASFFQKRRPFFLY
jgi:hypothetical protein